MQRTHEKSNLPFLQALESSYESRQRKPRFNWGNPTRLFFFRQADGQLFLFSSWFHCSRTRLMLKEGMHICSTHTPGTQACELVILLNPGENQHALISHVGSPFHGCWSQPEMQSSGSRFSRRKTSHARAKMFDMASSTKTRW